MNKVVCEICGTDYPDSASACPICGYPRNEDDGFEQLETELPENIERRREKVKGGRFSNKNVKKRRKAAQEAAVEERSGKAAGGKKKKSKKRKKSNRGLAVIALVLFLAVLAVGAYIGIRFFQGKDAYRETTVPTETQPVTQQTVPVETGIACTDIVIGDIDLNKGIEFLGMGRAWRVNASVVPQNTTDTLNWTSADENVARINVNDGRVEILSVGPGSTTVTVSCGSVSKSFPVVCSFDAQPTDSTGETTAEQDDTRPEGVLALDVEDISFFAVDESYTINPGVGIAPEDVSWSSDDEDVAVVDENGKVVAVGAGTCEITAEYDGEEAVCIVRCKIEEETKPSVEDAGPPYKISHKDVSIRVGESFKLTLRDKDGDVVDVTWVGDEDVEIDGNTITGKGTGKVYVKCTHNGEEFVCIVRVG